MAPCPPQAKPKLSEDFHFLMRCLYSYLPKPEVATRSSKTENRFAQQYGLKFGTFAHTKGYECFLEGEQPLPEDQGFNALHEWLTDKVIGQKEPFGWKDYSLTLEQIRSVCTQASEDWQEGWVR